MDANKAMTEHAAIVRLIMARRGRSGLMHDTRVAERLEDVNSIWGLVGRRHGTGRAAVEGLL